MNTDRILNLAAMLDELPAERFNLAHWWDDEERACGAVGCIAGWTVAMYGEKPHRLGNTYIVSHIAEGLLGLTDEQGVALFTPHHRVVAYEKVRPRHAAMVLRHLAETGQVDWSVAGAKVAA